MVECRLDRARFAAASLLLSLGANASTLPAQRVVSSVDLSGTAIRYADTVRAAGTSISPSLRIDWSRVTINAAGSASQLGGSGWSFQGALNPSVFTPSAGRFAGELAGSFGGSTHEDGTRTGQTLGIVRAYLSGAGQGLWAGGGLGETWDGSAWHNVQQAEAGVWLERAALTSLATVTPIVVGGSIHYTDYQAAVSYRAGGLDFGVTAGARSGSVGAEIGGTSRAWGSASVVAWLNTQLAIAGSAGSYPVDLTQGFPGGRFLSVALRIASRNARLTTSSRRLALDALDRAAAQTRAAGVTRFEVVRRSDTATTLRVYAPTARSVDIDADFTQWQPLRLARTSDGWWSATVAIAPGTYEINLRIDGGRWLAPPGLLTTTDEFEGVIGLLTIE
jgi:hypothetical protein